MPYPKTSTLQLTSRNLHGGNRNLFQSRNGGPTSRVQAHRIIAKAFAASGIFGQPRELETHTLRKTFAAKIWIAHDQNISKLQNALGHASPASTVAYLSFEDSEQQAAVTSAFAEI